MAAFMCKKGHLHSSQEKAEVCYICKRRAKRHDSKRVAREFVNEIVQRTTKEQQNG